VSLPQRIASLLGVAAARGVVPGAVALGVNRDGVLFEVAAGRRDLSAPAAMTTDTIVALASMTKALVTAGAMQLVEQGRLELDAPVADLLPVLAAPRVLQGFDPDGEPVLTPARTPITLRHLLTHTAGFGYPDWNAPLGRYLEQAALPRVPVNFGQVEQMPLLFEPGTRWNYSIAIDMVGLMIEAVTRQSLDRYLREHLFLPLGMENTGFLLTPAQQARRARVHRRLFDASLEPIDWPAGQGQGFTGGGGGLCGTAGDYGRFLRLLLNGGKLDGVRLLGEATVAEMARNQIGTLEVPTMVSARPERSNDADLFPGMVKKWGLGFLINTERGPNGRSAGSLAWGGLCNTWFWLDPARGLGGCLLTQVLPFADPGVLELLGAVEREVYAG
jgi:methyl acetate hydrolase